MRKSVVFLSLLAAVPPMVGFAACKGQAGDRCRYQIEAEYFEADRRLDATMEVYVPNNTDNVMEELPFSLWGDMEIKSVTGAEWRLTDGDKFLSAEIPAPLYPDESVRLTVEYSLTLPLEANRQGVGEHCVNLSCFYPALCAMDENGFLRYEDAGIGDPFVYACADFDVTLTVPERFTAAYGGEGSAVTENGKKTYHVIANNVRDTAFVLGEFRSVKTERGGVPVEYYYFSDEAPEETLKVAAESLSVYAELFGEYPYPRYTFAETDFPLGGMEYSAFAMISASLRREDRPAVVAHETAHQWWYGKVGSNQYENAWQDEGLAEYSVALFYEKMPMYGDYRKAVNVSESAYRAYFSVASQLSKETNTSMTRPLSSFSGEYEYRILAYDKGVVLLDRVRETVGDRRFFASLKRYAEKYAGKIASPEDMISCFGAEPLFSSFLEGKCVI